MNHQKSVFLVFILLVSTLSVFAQPRDIKNGLEFYDLGEWAKARDLLKDGYTDIKDKELKAEVTFKIAECYNKTYNYRVAESWYNRAIRRGYENPEAILYYADMLKMNEKYDEALIEYRKYLEKVPGDERGDFGVKSCELAAIWKNDPTRYKVEAMAFFNDREADFSPAFAKRDFRVVYFASSREGVTGGKVSNISGVNFYDIFETSQDRKGKWSVPTPLPPPVNTEFEEAGCSLNKKANVLYFTRCAKEKFKVLGCNIYEAQRKGRGWGEPTKIDIAHDSVDIKFPVISSNELTLYFAADIPGGYGGSDIWMVKRAKKTQRFGEPINLGPEINTFGNEWPSHTRGDSTMYFASDGHYGMGGMDIFMATMTPDGKWEIENMKYPINSSHDDFGIIFQGDEEMGYFSSNRPGGKGSNDIFYFELPGLNFEVKGFVTDLENDAPMSGVKVAILGDNGYQLEMESEADGSYRFPKLRAGADYTVTAMLDGYYTGKYTFSTKDAANDEVFESNLVMEKIVIGIPRDISDIYYDLNKATLRPESMVSLDKMVAFLEDNPKIVIQINAHTDYQGDNAHNDDLSQRRAKSVVDYLISKGIEDLRLSSRGFGESTPRKIDEKLAEEYSFLKLGDELTESFIKALNDKEKIDACNQINRRTEFQVERTDFVSTRAPKDEFGYEDGDSGAEE